MKLWRQPGHKMSPFPFTQGGNVTSFSEKRFSSKALKDYLSEKLNEMQNGSRTEPILLREHAGVLQGKVIVEFYNFFLLNL